MNHNLSGEFYEFAHFRLYPKRRTLLLDDHLVSVGGRAFDILSLLVSRAGMIVSTADLRASVWSNISVEETNLRVQISMLRKVLSQREEAKRAIETVPLRGYCFILPVHHHVEKSQSAFPRPWPGTGLFPLPRPIIGREDAIEIIGKALEGRRLVWITGPGGIGKTTVAITIANRCAHQFEGEITFVDLSGTNDGKEIATIIAESLGLETLGSVFSTLCAHLRACKSLLILDTCEHIVQPVTRFAVALLNHCAELRLLVTSREALRAAGEWTFQLPSLTFPEEDDEINDATLAKYTAITLFIDRINWFTRFEVQGRDLPMLAEICRRLDGIPLALEVAALRVADLGLRKIAEQLDDRFHYPHARPSQGLASTPHALNGSRLEFSAPSGRRATQSVRRSRAQ